MFISYAQNFEDVRLWRALRDVENGRYIDIGAQDPIVDSVSRAFYEQGWRGLHVEPSPAYAEKLRLDRPDETVIQSVVGARSGMLTFYDFPGTGLGTADMAVAQRHVDAGRSMDSISIPCTTLAFLFQSFGGPEIHWLKIDVEGFEREVLRGWSGSKVRPWVVVVESTLPLTQIESHASWERLLLRRGYRFACFDGLNRFYVAHAHLELMDTFTTAPNVFDAFALSGTSTASFSAVSIAKIRRLEDKERKLEAAREADAVELGASRTAARAASAREDDLSQRLSEARQEHIAALHAGAATELRLAGQLQMARDETIRLWNAGQRRESDFARHTLRAQNDAAQALAEREHRLAERDQRIATLHGINERQRSFVRNVFASRSWRITAPMRRLIQLMRGMLRNPAIESLESIWAADQATLDPKKVIESAPPAPLPMPTATVAVLQELALRASVAAQAPTVRVADESHYLPDVAKDP